MWRYNFLKVHPMELIMVSQFWCAIAYWCIATSELSCKWKTYDLFSWTVYFSNEPYDQFNAVFHIYQAKLAIQGFSYTAYLMLNMFICLDLFLVIRNPFGSKTKRMEFYYLVSYSVSFIMALFFAYFDTAASYMQVILMFTYILAAFSSLIFCFRRLNSTGLS